MSIPWYRPAAAPAAVFKGKPLPERSSNWISRATFHWVGGIMKVGYSRPIEPDDLWTLTEDLQCQNIAEDLQGHYMQRIPPSKRRARDASRMPGIAEDGKEDALSDTGAEARKPAAPALSKTQRKKVEEGKWAVEDGQVYDQSLLKAMYKTVRKRWWVAVGLKAIGAILQVTAPLVTRLLIEQITVAHTYHRAQRDGTLTDNLVQPKGVGHGVGLAVALFGMLMTASLLVYQALQIGSMIGFMMRSALIDLIGRKSMSACLIPREGGARSDSQDAHQSSSERADKRKAHDNGLSRCVFLAPMTLDLVVQPIQILVGLGLIIYTLGYSALVGLAVLALAGPMQAFMFSQMVKYRQLQLTYIDARVKLLSEVVDSIRSVKLYAYTNLFGQRVEQLRVDELKKLKVNGFNRATMNATMVFIPTLAAVLTFITYGLTGHTLDAATIFTGLQFFNVLKTPIAFLPMCFTAVSCGGGYRLVNVIKDTLPGARGYIASGALWLMAERIGHLLRSDEMPPDLDIVAHSKYAIDVKGSYTFEERLADDEHQGDSKDEKAASESPFSIADIRLKIPRGGLTCIIGRVGTGKSALLQGLLGEMRQSSGRTVFSGPVSYVPQQPWIHSGTIRDNIAFSAADSEIDTARLDWVIDACCLRDDLRQMTHGLATRVGEKGITLSGGQRQRLALARAAYDSTASIVLLDDCLSAVDAHVAHKIFQNCILQGPLADRTRVLVTHNLECLPRADWLVVMDQEKNVGRIVQQGTYASLTATRGILQSLTREFARPSTVHSIGPNHRATTGVRRSRVRTTIRPSTISAPPDALIDFTPLSAEAAAQEGLDEERETGAVSWKVYKDYIRATGSWSWVIVSGCLLVMTQIVNVANSLFLGWWSGDEFGLGQEMYMVIYAGLGVGIAIFTWSASFLMFLAGLRASFQLFNRAWYSVLRAKVSWHDKTPSGRIISRLSKDIEAMDDRLAGSWEQFLSTALAVFGTFGLVLYVYPYLGLAFIPLTFFFYLSASFYRHTSREIKRVDSISRSFIYSSFGEQLNGLSVIRAFRKRKTFEKRLQDAINNECQAYILTLTIQRWLGVRLDFFSNLLVMLIAIFGSLFRTSVDPAKFGVVLTYTLSAASLFANLVSLYAQVEQEMNNVERILHYTTLPLESPPHLPGDPDDSWPKAGTVTFDSVCLRYAPALPLVLKDLSFEVKAGEKVGVIGRTGAGKSSLAQGLFRMVEIESGSIRVDGRDVKDIGLDRLRSALAVIPQDAFLFEGSVRDNIDPLGLVPDSELNACLELIHSDPAASTALQAKLRLDAVVEHEGSNYSAGERQLLALVRALVKGSKILLLDEATSSVDPETDALIQRIIQKRLKDVTLISIAHRLQTVAYYDRILVLDAGEVAEYDTPLNLYDTPNSIFRSLCDRVRLRRDDLVRIKQDATFAAAIAGDRSSLMYHFTIADAWIERGPVYTGYGWPTTPPNSVVSRAVST